MEGNYGGGYLTNFVLSKLLKGVCRTKVLLYFIFNFKW